MPSPSRRGAQKPLGAALRHPAVAQAHELGVGRAVSADQLRMRAHRGRGRARRPRAARAARTRAPSARASARRSTTPQPSTAVGIDSGSTSAAAATSASIACWHGMRGEPVALGRPAVRRGRASSIAACFPEQLCSRRVGSGPHSRSSSVASAFASRLRTGSSWSGRWEVRRAGDRDLGVVEVGPRADERQRLDRLRRAAEERDERRDRRTTRRPRRRDTATA